MVNPFGQTEQRYFLLSSRVSLGSIEAAAETDFALSFLEYDFFLDLVMPLMAGVSIEVLGIDMSCIEVP